ncbi:exo-alpha-sialidase [Actinocorallia longicatena]|uniref:Exo-alpha-sialidase n=1 Tax=Actinocorallia longicatena TaxID=111803 RepID=A0ABP6PVT0_9ACTN
MSVLLAIGTVKGLFLARSEDRLTWDVSGPHLPFSEIYSFCFDSRRGRLLAGVSNPIFGPGLAISEDQGATWKEGEQTAIAFPEDTGTSLERVWQITVGPDGRIYAGTQPSALFTSDDDAATFTFGRALWDHPHRPEWGEGFGGQAIHTILPHPADPEKVLVAMSTGGVYKTEDGGASWTAHNTGIEVVFQPERFPEFGQCVHKVARDPENPECLYLQNHCGVYRSDDGGDTWNSIADGLPGDFGFVMVAHPRRGGVIYSFPINGDENGRYPVGHRCRVYRSQDAGETWEALTEGLPEEPFYPTILRDAMCVDDADPAGVYFGSRSGEVFASADEGDSWVRVAAHLPDVTCVRAAVI